MPEEKPKNDLNSVSRSWSERVKDIRRMAGSVRQEDAGDPAAESPLPDEELFAGAVYEQLSEEQVFSGNVDFYGTLKEGGSIAANGAVPVEHRREPAGFSGTSKVLIGCGMLLGLGFILYGSAAHLLALRVLSPAHADASLGEHDIPDKAMSKQAEQESAVLLDKKNPVSLEVARDYFRQGDYARAAAVYHILLTQLDLPEQNNLRDFLNVKLALCVVKTSDAGQAPELLKAAARSDSVLVRAMANYYLCLWEMENQQYLSAYTRACRTLSLLDAIEPERYGLQDLGRNCLFLAAEALSRQVLAFSDSDTDLPEPLWPQFDDYSGFLDDAGAQELATLLTTGAERFKMATLGSRITPGEETQDVQRWTVACREIPSSELLSRTAAACGYDLAWGTGLKTGSETHCAVSLYLEGASAQDCLMAAAGCAGLLAKCDDGSKQVEVFNPAGDAPFSQQHAQLCDAAVSCWQRFIFAYYQDDYLANAHFALGLLHAAQSRIPEAMTQYKMVASRFHLSDLASEALANSAKLHMDLHNYQQAYNDLKEVVEQYPDHQGIDRAYLLLADVARTMGRRDEAVKFYGKVYFLNRSAQTRAVAALEAGRACYDDQDYLNAEKWLTRYLPSETDKQDYRFLQAQLLLGKIWYIKADTQSACDVLQRSLAGPLSRADYLEAIGYYVQSCMREGRFVEAMNVLNEASSRQLSPHESVDLLVLRSRTLRSMGLVEQAVVILNGREEYLIDPHLKAMIACELGECYVQQDDLERAYKKLTQALEWADTEPLTQRTLLQLADVCFKQGFDSHAIHLCTRLLKTHPEEPLGREALQLMATVYHKQNNYDRAVSALLGQWQ